MLVRKNWFLKYVLLFFFGGFAYGMVEIVSRGFSHISMFFAGGISFLLIGAINKIFPWDMAVTSQMLLSSLIITCVELITGLIVNVRLGLDVWSYSHLPYNYKGQICFLFSNIWFFLSLPAILIDDYLRYWVCGEEKPRYKWF